MNPIFVIIALVTFLAAVSVMTLRNLVHCALALSLVFVGLAAMYLYLGAQFIGFAQVLVYVGAVAILIVFAILLTRSDDRPGEAVRSPGWVAGALVAMTVFAVLGWAVLNSGASTGKESASAPEATVHQIGDTLMTKYVLPLEVVGLLLTAAMIGAVIIAMREGEGRE